MFASFHGLPPSLPLTPSPPSSSDPIKYVKDLLIEHSFMSEAEVKDLEKRVRNEVKMEVDEAKKG